MSGIIQETYENFYYAFNDILKKRGYCLSFVESDSLYGIKVCLSEYKGVTMMPGGEYFDIHCHRLAQRILELMNEDKVING